MATLAESLVSSTSRSIKLRMRPDLTARQQRYHGDTYWVVKEPIGLNYFRFHEEEYAILQMLDGHTSLEEIKDTFEADFAPQKITYTDLQQFIGMLHRSGLVISDAPGQGRQLRKRRDQKRRREWLGKWANLFALRFRGVDPDRFLNWMYRYTAWFFHPITVTLSVLLGLSALLLVMVQFEVFQSRLPTFHEFFGPSNWLFLGVTMGLVKILHEIGHGLSCKHFRGECHELGLMFLVFTPCLYCNVSDSWMLPNKWHRAFIAAAGMYVEMILAAIATFVWWFSDPGLLNHLALSLMFVSSVSTLMFNGNPLLRFDGYYILMDLAEIPNLRQKSTEVLKRFMVGVCLGLEQPDNPFLPQRNRFLFGLYTVAAVIYRWLVVLSIVLFLNKVFEPYGLKIIGQIIAFSGFFGLVVQPLWAVGKFFYQPGRMHKVKRHRVAASLAVVLALILLVLFLPLPYAVNCTLEVSPKDAETVYVDVAGIVRAIHVQEGAVVPAGKVLMELENTDLELEVAKLQGRLDLAVARLRSLEEMARLRDETASRQIAVVRKERQMFEKQLEEKEAKLKRLKIRAPIAGVVIPAPPRPARHQEGRLPTWSGSPLDNKNIGALFNESDMVCRIAPEATAAPKPEDSRFEAILVVDQTDIEAVDEACAKSGEPEVRIQLDAFPGHTIQGKITGVARVELKYTPESLSTQAGGELNTVTDRATGEQRPLSTSYQARAPLTDDALGELKSMICTGLRGRAKIYTRWQSLGKRTYRYLARTFHFEL